MDETSTPLTDDEIVTTPDADDRTRAETGDADTDDTDADTDDTDADTDDTDADTDDTDGDADTDDPS
jgi:hypothetical protein